MQIDALKRAGVEKIYEEKNQAEIEKGQFLKKCWRSCNQVTHPWFINLIEWHDP